MSNPTTTPSDSTTKPPILIVGAGPTGLLLALWLQRFGVPYRLVDRAAGRGVESRAVVVQGRTLEFYRQLGIVDDITQAGMVVQGVKLHHTRVPKGTIPVAQGGAGLSKFPFVLSLPQEVHEEILEKKLTERGGRVERGIELTGFEDAGDIVRVGLKKVDSGEEEKFEASYVAGCDGFHSVVRRALGVEMSGSAYDTALFVTDVDIGTQHRFSHEYLNMCLSDQGYCMMIPLRQAGKARLVGTVPDEHQKSKNVTYADVAPIIEHNVAAKVEKVNWFSYYRVHHKSAEKFRVGRVFVLGDAAHVHSPVGGQGMNTGFGDATNLAWKLAAVHKGGQAPAEEILDTYGPERIAFAKQLVGTTDRAFSVTTSKAFGPRLFRNWILPSFIPFVLQTAKKMPDVYRKVSQLAVDYRHSALSQDVGKAKGSARAGDRLPWVGGEGEGGTDNFEPLLAAEWQAHVYGGASDELKKWLEAKDVPLHIFPYGALAQKAGLGKDVLYLVRPDGHIGLQLALDEKGGAGAGERALGEYVGRWRVGAVRSS